MLYPTVSFSYQNLFSGMNLMKQFPLLWVIKDVYFFPSVCIFIKKKPQPKEWICACVCVPTCLLSLYRRRCKSRRCWAAGGLFWGRRPSHTSFLSEDGFMIACSPSFHCANWYFNIWLNWQSQISVEEAPKPSSQIVLCLSCAISDKFGVACQCT